MNICKAPTAQMCCHPCQGLHTLPFAVGCVAYVAVCALMMQCQVERCRMRWHPVAIDYCQCVPTQPPRFADHRNQLSWRCLLIAWPSPLSIAASDPDSFFATFAPWRELGMRIIQELVCVCVVPVCFLYFLLQDCTSSSVLVGRVFAFLKTAVWSTRTRIDLSENVDVFGLMPIRIIRCCICTWTPELFGKWKWKQIQDYYHFHEIITFFFKLFFWLEDNTFYWTGWSFCETSRVTR